MVICPSRVRGIRLLRRQRDTVRAQLMPQQVGTSPKPGQKCSGTSRPQPSLPFPSCPTLSHPTGHRLIFKILPRSPRAPASLLVSAFPLSPPQSVPGKELAVPLPHQQHPQGTCRLLFPLGIPPKLLPSPGNPSCPSPPRPVSVADGHLNTHVLGRGRFSSRPPVRFHVLEVPSPRGIAEENLITGVMPKHQLGMEVPTKAPSSSASRQGAVKARKRLFPFQKKGRKTLRAQPLCWVKFTALIVPSCTLMRH